MCRTFSSAALLLILGPALASAQEPQEFAQAWEEVVREYHQSLGQQGVVGSSLMFVHRGVVRGQAFHGRADLASGREVDSGTIYHWASITKTFTGIAVMQLRDRGLLDLEDRILDWLPELRRIHDPEGQLEAVTLRHLLSHSAGFRGPTWPWGGEQWHPHEPTSWEQLVAMLPYTRLEFEPGSRFSYSNPGIVFLGRVIELISGEDYEVYMDKNVLDPLGMFDSYFDHTPYHLLERRSNNYVVDGDQITANGLDFDTGITVSNGGLNAPLPDMVRYLSFLCGDGDEQALAVLKRESLEEMWRPLNPAGEADGIQSSMGLAYFVLEDGRTRYIGHTGGQKAFVSFVYVHPETHTAAICAYNTISVGAQQGPQTRSLLAQHRGALFERIFPLFDAE